MRIYVAAHEYEKIQEDKCVFPRILIDWVTKPDRVNAIE